MKNKIEYIANKKGYIVSEEGIFYNSKGEKIGIINEKGYIKTNIKVDGKLIKLKVHRLQAFQKFGNKLYQDGIIVRHLDGNKLNNSWNNIMIGTHSDNMMDIPKQVRLKRALHATSFTRKYDKIEIQAFHKISKSYKKTMDKFNITSKGTLCYILNN